MTEDRPDPLSYFGGPKDGERARAEALAAAACDFPAQTPQTRHRYSRGKAPWSPPGETIEAFIYLGQW